MRPSKMLPYSGFVIVVSLQNFLAFPGNAFQDFQQHPQLSRSHFMEKQQVAMMRSTELPGWGELGDHINDFIQIVLDALTIVLHQAESPDCALRLLCEASQRSSKRSFFKSALSYIVGLALTFWLEKHTMADSLMAMRSGRRGQNCLIEFPKCPISL